MIRIEPNRTERKMMTKQNSTNNNTNKNKYYIYRFLLLFHLIVCYTLVSLYLELRWRLGELPFYCWKHKFQQTTLSHILFIVFHLRPMHLYDCNFLFICARLWFFGFLIAIARFFFLRHTAEWGRAYCVRRSTYEPIIKWRWWCNKENGCGDIKNYVSLSHVLPWIVSFFHLSIISRWHFYLPFNAQVRIDRNLSIGSYFVIYSTLIRCVLIYGMVALIKCDSSIPIIKSYFQWTLFGWNLGGPNHICGWSFGFALYQWRKNICNHFQFFGEIGCFCMKAFGTYKSNSIQMSLAITHTHTKRLWHCFGGNSKCR